MSTDHEEGQRATEETHSHFQVVADTGVTMLGIVPAALPPKPLILRHVEPGSWAEQNGVSIGDELTMVNDVQVMKITLKELDNFLRRERPLKLTFASKRVQNMERMTADEFRELKRASTDEIDEFVENSQEAGSALSQSDIPGSMTGRALPWLNAGDEVSIEAAITELVGTWVYGNCYEYSLCRTPAGPLYFEETRPDERAPSMVKRVSGTLYPDGDWLLGEIVDTEQRQLGWIRMRYFRETRAIVSSVRLTNEDVWSEDTVAHKVRPGDGSEALAEGGLLELGKAKPQIADGTEVWPEHWGITRQQCKDLLQKLRSEPEWDASNDVYKLVSDFVVPWTRGSGLSYALQLNKGAPKAVNLMVSHAWNENAEEFLDTIRRSTSDHDVLFICALSMYQAGDTTGPTLRQQQGQDPNDGPCQRVLAHIADQGSVRRRLWRFRSCLYCLPMTFLILAVMAFFAPIIAWGCLPSIDSLQCAIRSVEEVDGLLKVHWIWSARYRDWIDHAVLWKVVPLRASLPVTLACLILAVATQLFLQVRPIYDGRVLAVPNRQGSLFHRLWCIQEVLLAKSNKIPVMLARSLAWAGPCDSESAECTDQIDQDRIRKWIAQDDTRGYKNVDKTLRFLRFRHQMSVTCILLSWLFALVVIRAGDRRVVSELHRRDVGHDDLNMFTFSVLGIFTGIVVDSLVMYGVVRLSRGAPRCCFVFLTGLFLLVAAGAVAGPLMYTGRINNGLPKHWTDAFNFFTDECFGYQRDFTAEDMGCSRLLRFLNSLMQILVHGAWFLILAFLGALSCPRLVHEVLRFGLLLLVAGGAFVTTSIVAESKLPDMEYAFPVFLFYLTIVLSRCAVPVLIVWAAVSRWGVRISGGQCCLNIWDPEPTPKSTPEDEHDSFRGSHEGYAVI